MALEALNADPDCRPAVIGIDVLYTGESDPELDAYLAEAAGAYDNVVVASVANFDAQLVTQDDGSFYMQDYAIASYEEPYDALKAVTAQGHINAMYDQDGVLRHGILQIDLPDGRSVPLFAYAIYQKYALAAGLPVELEVPTDSLHRFYVDFSALPGGFYDGVSVADLLSGDFPAELFADAIVLIGPYAPGLSDYVTTAIDRASLMYGVEYQANIIQQMIQRSFKREVSDLVQAAALFVIAAACLWVFIGGRLFPSTLLWAATAGGGVLLYRVSTARMGAASALVAAGHDPVLCGRGGGQLRARLPGKAPHLRNVQAVCGPGNRRGIASGGRGFPGAGGKLCDIAVLFVDIRGFTTMSEASRPRRSSPFSTATSA